MDATGIAAALAALLGIVLLLLQRHFASVDSNKDAITAAQTELRKALAEGRIDDANKWAAKVRELGGSL